ncbi:MAG: putative molybdenum carrier protein, partial [Candidatus Thiodiazotropha sp.]
FSSDATLIVATDPTSHGTQRTIQYCKELNKPYLLIDPATDYHELIRVLLNNHSPRILNIAGNRESKSKGIAAKTAAIIQAVLSDTSVQE